MIVSLRGLDRAFAVERDAERVHDPAEEGLTDGYFEKAAGGAHLVALVQVPELAEDDGPHLVLLEVQGEAIRVARKLEQLAGHSVLQAVDLRDAVARGHDAPHVRRDCSRVEVLEAFLDDFRNLFGADSHYVLLLEHYEATRRRRSCCNLVATVPSTTWSPY